MNGVHIVNKRLHRLVNTAYGAVHSVLAPALLPFQAVERSFQEVVDRSIIEVREVHTSKCLNFLQFLNIR